jgi:hypothetical protein
MPLYSATNPLPVNMERRRTFNPSRISGLDLWLDAADRETLFDSTTGGNYVTTNGAGVKRWEDKSGNGFHATESTNPPLLLVNDKNNRNGLDFRFNPPKRLLCSFSSRNYTTQTVFVVAKYDSTTSLSYSRLFSQRSAGNNDYDGTQYIPLLRNITQNVIGSWKSSGHRSPLSLSNQYYIFRALHDTSFLNVKINDTVGADYATALNINLVNFVIGDMINAAGGTDGAQWNNTISEVLVYRKAVSSLESSQITSYLNSKWAVY